MATRTNINRSTMGAYRKLIDVRDDGASPTTGGRAPGTDVHRASRSRRANERRSASDRLGLPDDLLPVWLGGNPSGEDRPAVPQTADGRPHPYDLIRSADALELYVEENGYPWAPSTDS